MKKLILIAIVIIFCCANSFAQNYDSTMLVPRLFIGDEYKIYQSLSPRGKVVFDSLSNKMAEYDDMQLQMESHYMKYGKKVEKFWRYIGDEFIVSKYYFYRTENSSGFRLLNEYKIKINQ